MSFLEFETKELSSKRSDYQIEISQDGKFAVIFNTVNLRIKVLENTDYRPFKSDKDPPRILGESETIDKTIAHFKINYDFEIDEFYDPEIGIKNDDVLNDSSSSSSNIVTTENEDKFRWSFDVSNLRVRNNKYFILIAVSCINIDKDMRRTNEEMTNERNNKNRDYRKGHLTKSTVDINKMRKGTTIDNINGESEGKGTAIVKIAGESKGEMRGGTVIYCLKLKKPKESNEKIWPEIEQEEESEEKQKKETKDSYVLSEDLDCFYSDSVSGICKFVEVTDKSKNNVEQERFIILNFHGIYNFEFFENSLTAQEGIRINLKEEFEYPKIMRRELDNWYTNTEDEDTKSDCMRRLRSCIYGKYFLITQYKNDAQLLEIYNLAKMELEAIAKKVENEDKSYNYDTFSIGRLQLCFTRGINHVLLYYMENCLQVASKKFDEIEKIHLLEFFDGDEKILIIGEDSEESLKFIIWDLYNTDKIISLSGRPIKDLYACLAVTSGNILHVDNKGNVTSVLKKIENKLKELEEKEPKLDRDAAPIKDEDKHKIYYDENAQNFNDFNNDKVLISNFKKIADEMEPWVLDNYEKNSYCLYYNKKGTETEFLQLIVGRSTIQIWHQIYDDDDKKNDRLPNKGNPFLEYIWTNEIPVDQERNETRLRIEEFKYGSNDIDGLNGEKDESNKYGSNNGKNGSNKYGSNYKLNDFSLKIYWRKNEKNGEIGKDGEIENDKEVDKDREIDKETSKTAENVVKKMEIKLKDVIETFNPVIHACKALRLLNKHYKFKFLVDNYKKVHKYEKIVSYVTHIVWRFAKHNPEQFKWLDFRYNFMRNLILGDCDHLIKYILFGDEKTRQNTIRHIPKNISWPGDEFIDDDDLNFIVKCSGLQDSDLKPENNMELAIYHCKGRELKDTTMIAYLLEYYTVHATDSAGWMCTVSKALPLLFKYNYADYVRKLFRKECFANQNQFSAQDPDKIIPEEYLARRNHNIKFRAFRPIVKLKSDQQELRGMIFKLFKDFKLTIHKWIEDFDNDLGRSSLALRIVPLPGFIINNIPKEEVEYTPFRIILNILWLLFIPRWYKIKRADKHKLSPFSRMVLYENNDDIYDNPAIEAVINYRWQKVKIYFLFIFIQFLIFAICFAIVCWEYLNRSAYIDGNYLAVLVAIFYYLAIFQFIMEILQFNYRPRQYIVKIFNIVDIISVALSVTMMSMMIKNLQLSDGFGSVNIISTELIVVMSFSIFFLCIKLMFYLRFIPEIGFYLYYSIIIFKTILPFFIFMIIMIFSFALSMFILLRDPVNHINTKDQTLSGSATDNLTNQTLNIQLKSDFNPTSRVDNPFSSLSDALLAAYFWINGNWIQRDEFDFWAVDLFSVVASIVLVIFVQNMLISYMGGMHEKADIKARRRLLRDRARYIAEYEALHQIYFWHHGPDPKYIYYFGQSKYFEDWFLARKADQGAIYKDFEEKSTYTNNTRYIFEESSYDKVSILVYEGNIKTEIETDTISKIKNVENDVIDITDHLIEKLKDHKNEIENIEYIKNMIRTIHTKVEYLIKEFNEDNNK